MTRQLFPALAALVLSAGLCFAQEILIPVYPGSVLSIDPDQGSDPQCCDFVTTAPYSKVVEFFEKALSAKAMRIEELPARYPAMAQMVRDYAAQAPSSVELRVIPHSPVVLPGAKDPVPTLFEILGSNGEVRYTIDEAYLSIADQVYPADFRKRTGKLNMEEEAAEDRAEMDAQLAEQLKKEARAWAALARTHGVPIYSGAVYEESQGPTLSAYGTDTQSLLPLILGVFKSPDPFEKVRGFYASKMSVITYEAMMKRKGVDKFLAGSDYTGRAYTSKKRMDLPRDFFIAKGCVDVAVEEGGGDEKGSKVTNILFDFDPKCKGAEAMIKLLWPED